MKHNSAKSIGLQARPGLLLLTFLLGAATALAQGTPAAAPAMAADGGALSGKYEGSIKGSDERVSLELKSEGGKLSGRLQNGAVAFEVTEGNLVDGTLSLGFGKQAMLTVKVDGDMLVGELSVGSEKKPVELKKVGAEAPANPASAASFNLNGQWEGLADANGQPFPFLLTLKVEGETVTGSSSSQLGEATIKAGIWKDGQLAFQLEGQNGVIAMSATVVDGKLAGEFDFAGQLQGRWVAVKKN